MGTHGERRSLWARFRQWRRYRRILARSIRVERRSGHPVHPDTITRLKAEARRAARLTGD